jgi:hypothetical protein
MTLFSICASIALGLALLARIVDAISVRFNELFGARQVDPTKR